MDRLIIYGDIHGCYNEFISLRKQINIGDCDTEICVGDIITKGKKSIDVLRYVNNNNIKSVLGNHEDKIIRYLKHQKSLKKNPIVLNQDEQNIVNELNSSDIDYLNNMPLFIKLNNITIVHGGLSNRDNLEKLSNNTKSKILRIRYLDKNNNFISYGKEDSQSIFWADIYDGNQGFVVYGHQKFNEIKTNKYALGIDTGCAYGGKLTAAIFINKSNRFTHKDNVYYECIK